MKKSELKSILKPLVEECVREALFENGILASVVTEVLQGVQGANVIRESAPATRTAEVDESQSRQARQAATDQRLREAREKMLDAIGGDSYNGVNIFEGTTPLRSGGTPGGSPKPGSPLSGMDPSDPGIDISGLSQSMGNTWKKLAGGK